MDREIYHEQLSKLQDTFGDVPCISKKAAAKYLHKHPATLAATKGFPIKPVGKQEVVPLLALARWLACT